MFANEAHVVFYAVGEFLSRHFPGGRGASRRAAHQFVPGARDRADGAQIATFAGLAADGTQLARGIANQSRLRRIARTTAERAQGPLRIRRAMMMLNRTSQRIDLRYEISSEFLSLGLRRALAALRIALAPDSSRARETALRGDSLNFRARDRSLLEPAVVLSPIETGTDQKTAEPVVQGTFPSRAI